MMVLGAGPVLVILETPAGVADTLRQLGHTNAQGAADADSQEQLLDKLLI